MVQPRRKHTQEKSVGKTQTGSDIISVVEDDEPVAPDGGYGWVVLAASFSASVIVDGTCFAFGIFYLEFLDSFREDRSKTAWIGSVLNGMYMVTGVYHEIL